MSKSDRVVYVAGFINGYSQVKHELEKHYPDESIDVVADELGGHFASVEAFTLAEAMKDRSKVARAVRGADVITHSGGILAVEGTRPDSLTAFNGPLPTSIPRLLGRTLLKTGQMGTGVRSLQDMRSVARYTGEVLHEVVEHRREHFGLLRKIAKFDTFAAAGWMRGCGITNVNLVYTDRDLYFRPTEDNRHMADMWGITVVDLAGTHDELPLRPHIVVPKVLEVIHQ